MTENFIKITESMLKTFKKNPSQLLVYALISSYSNDNKDFFMSNRDTADYLGLTYQGVNIVLKKLIDKGFIQIVGKKGQRNIYKSVPLDKVQVQDVSNNSVEVEVEDVKELTEEELEEQKRMIQEMSERFKK